MEEFKQPEPPKPPQTKYVVEASEFIKAVKGEEFKSGKGLYRLNGSDIKQEELFQGKFLVLTQYVEYVILQEAIVIGLDEIKFTNNEDANRKVGFIFFRSILPSIRLDHSILDDWFLNNTFINGNILIYSDSTNGQIFLSTHSNIGYIDIDKNSQCGFIHVCENSESGDITVRENSRCRSIKVTENSRIGGIRINENSQVFDIEITKNSLSSHIRINKDSKCDSIKISKNSRCGGVSISENSSSGPLWVTEKSQNGIIDVTSKSEISVIWIHKNSSNSQFHLAYYSRSGDIIMDFDGQIEKIFIDQFSQAGSIEIGTFSQSGDIFIGHHCDCQQIFIHKNGKSGNIDVMGQCGEISIIENSQIGYILVRNISQSIKIENSSCSSLEMENNFSDVCLLNVSIQQVKFNWCNIEEFSWGGGIKGALYISYCKINNLNLSFTSLLKDGLVFLSDSQIFIANFNKLIVQGHLTFSNLSSLESPFDQELGAEEVKDIYRAVSSNWEKEIYKTKIELKSEQEKRVYEKREQLIQNSNKSLWLMANSSLGKTEITGCDLTGFRFEYRDSKLLDCFVSGTKLPKENIHIFNPDPSQKLNGLDELEQKVSIYNQFKKLFENQGNIVEATWYHAKGMEYQQQLLKWHLHNKTEKSKGKRLEQRAEYVGFWLNKVSNNHGESWFKALRFTILTSLFFFTLSLYSAKYQLDFSGGGWEFIENGWGYLCDNFQKYPGFFLPTHKLDYLSEGMPSPSKWHYFWDVLGRLVIGYGIYQFVSAFRRHGRK